jgi:transcriptional regulator with XRE-family HTH domain
MEHRNFGEEIRILRQKKEWTVKQFIEALNKDISPAYITKIEVHGEIPKPELICEIAEVLAADPEKLLAMAQKNKAETYQKQLEEKYKKAYGLFRTQRVSRDR